MTVRSLPSKFLCIYLVALGKAHLGIHLSPPCPDLAGGDDGLSTVVRFPGLLGIEPGFDDPGEP